VSRPPAWARALGRLLVRGPMREFVLGDLEERFVGEEGPRAARVARYVGRLVRSAWLAARTAGFGGIRADLRIALRQFRRRPRVYLGGSAVLAVGLGMATVTWGVRYGALGRDLPVSEPGRVAGVRTLDARTRQASGLSIDDATTLRRALPREVDALGLWTSTSGNLTDGEGMPEEVSVYPVTSDFFRILEITPLHGRVLGADDDRPGAPTVAVLGFRFWRERYAEDPDIVGRTIRIDGEAVPVVGVLPPDVGLTAHEDVWVPAEWNADRTSRELFALLRTASGVTPESLQPRLEALAARLAESGREAWLGVTIDVADFEEAYYGRVASVRDRVLRTGGLLLFVMALANVANLFLVSTRVRAHELALRRAIGAGRGRVVRQLVIESGLPALLGFLGATLIAWWGLDWYERASNAYGVGFVWQVYRLEMPHVVLLAAGAFASTIFVALAAASRELTVPPGSSLGSGRRTVGSGFGLGRAFLGVEVAVGAALFLVAALMIRSGWNLRTIDFDFAWDDMMTGDITLRGDRYADPADRVAFWEALERELEAAQGVESAAVGTQLPLIRCCGNVFRIEVQGRDVADAEGLPEHYVNGVSPGYFDTFERPVLTGRSFTSGDARDTEPIALVNEPFRDRYFPGETPVGRRVRLWRGGEPGEWRTIVGVAPHLWMDSDVDEHPEGLYVPLAQRAPGRASFAVRVSGGSPTDLADVLRGIVARLDPTLPANDLRSMPQLFRDRTRLYRREAPLFTTLGLAALFLAVAGLFAVVSYLASTRTRELGVRAALGAERWELVHGSLGGVLLPTALGSLVGLAVGLGLTRGFDRFVFEVDPWSPTVAVAAMILLIASSAVSSLVPALRASRVDLVEVLRAE
jgi:putative ABC transport system permease protein